MKQNTVLVVVDIDLSPISAGAVSDIKIPFNPVRLFVILWIKYLAL